MKFAELGLNDQLLEALGYMGFKKATPIQDQAIPAILDGRDLIACAQTGTGKTAAFVLPLLNDLSKHESEGIRVLIVVPTRELALQIEKEIQGFAYFLNINALAIYGGGDGINFSDQKRALVQGTDIIVATPGKLLAHMNLDYVDFSGLKYLVLDEADRMLDMGFIEDIQKIIDACPKKRQNLMFSATMPANIKQLASKMLTDPFEISIALSKPAEGVLQAVYLTYENQKIALIDSLIRDKAEYHSILIFSSTKRKVFEIAQALRAKKYDIDGISSELDQQKREEVLGKFRSKQTRILVATDVLSRGIDIKDINLIINFDAPNDAEDYVHRIGRTARADTTGVAITLINPDDMYKFKRIEDLI
ncbi:MAG: DEAD/DEAH box helicase, partial [Flavobacteriales bacterium]|nr:DEAD/DEAH box helicase [Flavobacteriales bacterium]